MSVAREHSEVIDIDAIESLIEDFEDIDPYERDQKKERQVQNHFIEPLLEALGWDTDTDQVEYRCVEEAVDEQDDELIDGNHR